MKNLTNKLVLFVLFSLTIINPAFTEPKNLMLLKNEIKAYHDSGQYVQEVNLKTASAEKYIMQQVALNEKRSTPQKLAIVLDIDETSLSNYHHMIHHDFAATHEQIHQDILAADAPAIEPTLALYKAALSHGVTVFFVTGRSQDEREATEKNLLQIGYTEWEELFLRPDNYNEKSIIPFKSQTRKLITQKGYTIIVTIGDQYSDLQGGYAKKGFKLPNPYYYLP